MDLCGLGSVSSPDSSNFVMRRYFNRDDTQPATSEEILFGKRRLEPSLEAMLFSLKRDRHADKRPSIIGRKASLLPFAPAPP